MDPDGPTAPHSAPEPGKLFAYIYFMTSDVEAARSTAPAHAEYWQTQQLHNYSGGPFSDRSGGLITFLARDHEHAEQLIDADPFRRERLLKSRWLKEWKVQRPNGQPRS